MDTFYLSSRCLFYFRALEVGRKNASMCGCDTAASGERASPLAVLDVVVLAPDLTSFTYFARWNEKGLDHDKDVGFVDTFDLSSVAGKFRVLFEAHITRSGCGYYRRRWFRDYLNLGPIDLAALLFLSLSHVLLADVEQLQPHLVPGLWLEFAGIGQDATESMQLQGVR